MQIQFTLNDKPVSADIRPDTLLYADPIYIER